MAESRLALEGLSVVEYGSLVAAPYCAKLLADAGAQVVKVEPPQGEELRHPSRSFTEDEEHSQAGLFQFLNTNKRSVTLDLYAGEGRQKLLGLLADADVLVWNGTPELGRRLRLGYRNLRATVPRLIVTAITPCGMTGPYRDFKGDEFILYNLGGLGYASPGLPDHVDVPSTEPPLHARAPVADITTGLVAAVATMGSIFARELDGKGRQVDVSGMESVASMVARNVGIYSYIREINGRLPKIFAHQPNAMLPCKDGWVVIATPYGQHWDRFVELMGNPEWASMEVFADGRLRGAYWDALRPLLEEWTTRYTGEEIMHMTQSRSIPCFPAFLVRQMAESEQIKAREFMWTVPIDGKPARVPGPPFKLTETPHTLRTPAPGLGQHNADVDGESRRPAPSQPKKRSGMPLDGVRVLDMGQVMSAPYCGRILAWNGADVIQIESRKRITTRGSPPFAYGQRGLNMSAAYNLTGANKRSCTLNLATPQGVELFKELVRISDVVIENYATRTMPNLGLTYETLRQSNPGIIMLSLSAFGRTGPMSDYVGLHSAVNLFSGVGGVAGYGPEDRPRILGSVLPDTLAGTAACLAILESLYYRNRTGKGQYIDIAMSETFINLIPGAVAEYTRNGRELSPLGNRDPGRAPNGVYRSKGTDNWVAVAITTEEEWRALCGVLGRPELADDPRFVNAASRWRNQDELDSIITQWTRRHSHYGAMHLMQAAGVPAGASLNPKDLLNDPHLRARHRIVRTDHPEAGRRRMLGMAWDAGEVPRPKYAPAPCIGQHTDDILMELLGLSDQELQRLRAEDVLT